MPMLLAELATGCEAPGFMPELIRKLSGLNERKVFNVKGMDNLTVGANFHFTNDPPFFVQCFGKFQGLGHQGLLVTGSGNDMMFKAFIRGQPLAGQLEFLEFIRRDCPF